MHSNQIIEIQNKKQNFIFSFKSFTVVIVVIIFNSNSLASCRQTDISLWYSNRQRVEITKMTSRYFQPDFILFARYLRFRKSHKICPKLF